MSDNLQPKPFDDRKPQPKLFDDGKVRVDRQDLVDLLVVATSNGGFDVAYYLDQNEDVKQAIEAGSLPSAVYHYVNYGFLEGRRPYAEYPKPVKRKSRPRRGLFLVRSIL